MKRQALLISGLILATFLVASGCSSLSGGSSDRAEIKATVQQLCSSLEEENTTGILNTYTLSPGSDQYKKLKGVIEETWRYSKVADCKASVHQIKINGSRATANISMKLKIKRTDREENKIIQGSGSLVHQFKEKDKRWKIKPGFVEQFGSKFLTPPRTRTSQ